MGYSPDGSRLEENVGRLIEVGAAGINIEDSVGPPKAPQFDMDTAASRVGMVRAAADKAGVPLVINARVDTLAGGGEWDEAMTRANAYLDAGADIIFMLGLSDEDKVKRALDQINGKVSVISNPKSVPLKTLADLGVSRVSFGPFTLGLTLKHLRMPPPSSPSSATTRRSSVSSTSDRLPRRARVIDSIGAHA